MNKLSARSLFGHLELGHMDAVYSPRRGSSLICAVSPMSMPVITGAIYAGGMSHYGATRESVGGRGARRTETLTQFPGKNTGLLNLILGDSSYYWGAEGTLLGDLAHFTGHALDEGDIDLVLRKQFTDARVLRGDAAGALIKLSWQPDTSPGELRSEAYKLAAPSNTVLQLTREVLDGFCGPIPI